MITLAEQICLSFSLAYANKRDKVVEKGWMDANYAKKTQGEPFPISKVAASGSIHRYSVFKKQE